MKRTTKKGKQKAFKKKIKAERIPDKYVEFAPEKRPIKMYSRPLYELRQKYSDIQIKEALGVPYDVSLSKWFGDVYNNMTLSSFERLCELLPDKKPSWLYRAIWFCNKEVLRKVNDYTVGKTITSQYSNNFLKYDRRFYDIVNKADVYDATININSARLLRNFNLKLLHEIVNCQDYEERMKLIRKTRVRLANVGFDIDEKDKKETFDDNLYQAIGVIKESTDEADEWAEY